MVRYYTIDYPGSQVYNNDIVLCQQVDEESIHECQIHLRGNKQKVDTLLILLHHCILDNETKELIQQILSKPMP